jgi:hypothetical protein
MGRPESRRPKALWVKGVFEGIGWLLLRKADRIIFQEALDLNQRRAIADCLRTTCGQFWD